MTRRIPYLKVHGQGMTTIQAEAIDSVNSDDPENQPNHKGPPEPVFGSFGAETNSVVVVAGDVKLIIALSKDKKSVLVDYRQSKASLKKGVWFESSPDHLSVRIGT